MAISAEDREGQLSRISKRNETFFRELRKGKRAPGKEARHREVIPTQGKNNRNKQ